MTIFIKWKFDKRKLPTCKVEGKKNLPAWKLAYLDINIIVKKVFLDTTVCFTFTKVKNLRLIDRNYERVDIKIT